MPGESWYTSIHKNLGLAVQVWILVTPASKTRPWIYWEAGNGNAACPGGVVPIRINVTNQDLPSPLNHFQSYDGLKEGDGGVSELLSKVATQVQMKLSPLLLEPLSKKWTAAAEAYKPEEVTAPEFTGLEPEQVSRLELLLSRMEASLSRLALDTPANFVPASQAQIFIRPAALAEFLADFDVANYRIWRLGRGIARVEVYGLRGATNVYVNDDGSDLIDLSSASAGKASLIANDIFLEVRRA